MLANDGRDGPASETRAGSRRILWGAPGAGLRAFGRGLAHYYVGIHGSSVSMNNARPIEAVLFGAGRRGYHNFGQYALRNPDQLRFVAVAEPDPVMRERFASAHQIPGELRFDSWEGLVGRPQIAPVALNSTNDATHYRSTMAAIEEGYDVLLEKPMATSPGQCGSLVRAARRLDRRVWVCYELRNTDFFASVHRIVRSGRLGDVVSVEHRENVAYWHMAHSFVRGNWSNAASSGPMILTKCCHDMDLLFWILGRRVMRLSSFGSLRHFRPDQAPHPDVPDRCTDGCTVELECPFYAPRLYLDEVAGGLASAISIDGDRASREMALKTGPYGRCVYRCDNDVVDHQTVNMEFEGGTTVSLIMEGHSPEEGRTMRYDGTRATLMGTFSGPRSEITIQDNRSGDVERIVPHARGGHGGGDERLMAEFVRTVRGEQSPIMSLAGEALESHLMALASEQSRVHGGSVVEMREYRDMVTPGGEAT